MENFSALRIYRDRSVGLAELPEIVERLLGWEWGGRTVVRLAGDLT